MSPSRDGPIAGRVDGTTESSESAWSFWWAWGLDGTRFRDALRNNGTSNELW